MKILITKKGRKHYYYDKLDTVRQVSTDRVIEIDEINVSTRKIISTKGEIFELTTDIRPTNETFEKAVIEDRRGKFIKRERGFEVISKAQLEKDRGDFNIEIADILNPKRGSKKSACYDFFAPFEINLEIGQSITIPTGIKSYMLDDEVLKAYPRSNHGFKFFVRIANTVPIIDADYYNNPKNEGHIFIKIRNEGDKPLTIPKGEGMCQVMFQKYLLADGDNFENGEDRDGGIGSTNKK